MTITRRVRVVEHSDLVMLRAWRNHPAIRSVMRSQQEISDNEHATWFAVNSQDDTKRLVIIEDAGEALGFVQFNGLVKGQSSEWGFYARPDAQRGTGRRLGRIALDYAFDDLLLHKVYGQVVEYNCASINLHRKLGFVQEGLLRDHWQIGGRYHSVLYFGLLQEEWQEAQKFAGAST